MTNEEAKQIISECRRLFREARKCGYNPYHVDDVIRTHEALGLKWGDEINLPSEFSVGKAAVSNPAIGCSFDADDCYIIWDNGAVGRERFIDLGDCSHCILKRHLVRCPDYITDDVWNAFKERLMSYEPLDYDTVRDYMVFSVENGKKLLADYPTICEETRTAFKRATAQYEIEKKKKEIEELVKIL